MADVVEALLVNIREEICEAIEIFADRSDLDQMTARDALRTLASEMRDYAVTRNPK